MTPRRFGDVNLTESGHQLLTGLGHWEIVRRILKAGRGRDYTGSTTLCTVEAVSTSRRSPPQTTDRGCRSRTLSRTVCRPWVIYKLRTDFSCPSDRRPTRTGRRLRPPVPVSHVPRRGRRVKDSHLGHRGRWMVGDDSCVECGNCPLQG